MQRNTQEEEDRLNGHEQLLNDTQTFWTNLIQLKMAEFNFVAEKLKESYTDENYTRLEILAAQLRHLDHKREFEIKEYKKLEIAQNKFLEQRNKDLMTKLSQKLSEKFNHGRQKKMKSS
jgi:hypothetical protein